MRVSSFNFVGLTEKCDKKFNVLDFERKKIEEKLIHNTCTKLQNPTCNSSREIFVTNFPMYYTGVIDGKKEKEGKINISFVFCPTIYLATLKYKIRNEIL